MEVHLAHPAQVRGLVGMCDAPDEVLHRGVALTKETWHLCPDQARHPAGDEPLAPSEPLGLVKQLQSVTHPADPPEQKDIVRVARSQRRHRREVQGLMRVVQLGFEALEHAVEIVDAFGMAACVGELGHQQKQQLRIGWRPPPVHLLQVRKLRALPVC